MQLLISAQDVENYKVIKSELDRLRTMVEKSELWVDKKGSGKGEEAEAGAAKDKKEVSQGAGAGLGLPMGLGPADPRPLCSQRPMDEEAFLPPPGEKSSENYQIVKGVSAGALGQHSGVCACPLGGPSASGWPHQTSQSPATVITKLKSIGGILSGGHVLCFPRWPWGPMQWP